MPRQLLGSRRVRGSPVRSLVRAARSVIDVRGLHRAVRAAVDLVRNHGTVQPCGLVRCVRDGLAAGGPERAPQAELFEVSLFSLLTYLPFLAAETVELSGIVTTLFAAIAARHYAHANLSGPRAREAAACVFRVLAFLAESAAATESTPARSSTSTSRDTCIAISLSVGGRIR